MIKGRSEIQDNVNEEKTIDAIVQIVCETVFVHT